MGLNSKRNIEKARRKNKNGRKEKRTQMEETWMPGQNSPQASRDLKDRVRVCQVCVIPKNPKGRGSDV